MNPSAILRSSLVVALGAAALAAQAERIYGATTTALINFDSATPASFASVNFSGVAAGQTIRDIDFRPATGTMYALSSNGTTAAQLYTVNLTTGALTTVGAGFTLTGNTSADVSIDFNPTVDRLRVVTGSNGNYRANPIDGTLVAQDTSLNPSTLIRGLAYSNNVAGATSTTLYGYDYLGDALVMIGGVGGTPSPNGGTVSTVGSSGLNAVGSIGFDISGATGTAYLLADGSDGNLGEFYTVNLGTGATTRVGALDILPRVVGIAAAPVPEPSALAALGLGAVAMLRRRKRA